MRYVRYRRDDRVRAPLHLWRRIEEYGTVFNGSALVLLHATVTPIVHRDA
jgi:hypothetical protein